MLFNSTNQALRRMFELLNTVIVRTSSVNRMRGSGGGGDMSAHDWHAQAALMMAGLERELTPIEMASIYAHYGRELRGGERERWCADLLVQGVFPALPSGMHSRRGVEKLVRIYFGQDIGMRAVQFDFKCSQRTTYDYRQRIFGALNQVCRSSDIAAERVLGQQGVLIDYSGIGKEINYA